ncbi:MAG: acetyl-CoA decarbonylase/synthase complex subunit delta, partial [Candidatus Thermoplasmatota archaeon]|nr:acetyl-CoA decarbonylase/synthase complex subunit delta [Candidatus Thermoplasmatota archaeon]
MGFEVPKEKFPGRIREVAIGATSEQGGTRGARLVAGGSNGLPFHMFESDVLHKPLVAMDVVDTTRVIPDHLMRSMGPVMKEPVEWAKKCGSEWGADMLLLRLLSANPEEENRS